MLSVFKCSKSCAASTSKVWMLYVYNVDAVVFLQRLQCETYVFEDGKASVLALLTKQSFGGNINLHVFGIDVGQENLRKHQEQS